MANRNEDGASWRATGRRDSGRWATESASNDARNDRRGNGRWRGGRERGRGLRPNFFVGFRITTKSIIAKVEQLQQSIALAFPELEMCLIDPRTLHVTLCILCLPDDEGVERSTYWRNPSFIVSRLTLRVVLCSCPRGSKIAPYCDASAREPVLWRHVAHIRCHWLALLWRERHPLHASASR